MTTTATTTTPRNSVLVSIPADLATEITAYLEQQRAGRSGLRADRTGWVRDWLRLALAAEQAPKVQEAPTVEQAQPTGEKKPTLEDLYRAIWVRYAGGEDPSFDEWVTGLSGIVDELSELDRSKPNKSARYDAERKLGDLLLYKIPTPSKARMRLYEARNLERREKRAARAAAKAAA